MGGPYNKDLDYSGDFYKIEGYGMIPKVYAAKEEVPAMRITPRELFVMLAHGDETHRAWLKEAIDNIFDGRPVPAPRSADKLQLRAPLMDFAREMEQKLKKNDHKTGWRHLPVEALRRMLLVELEEFRIAQDFFSPEEARKELVDVANFAMMLWDRLGIVEEDSEK